MSYGSLRQRTQEAAQPAPPPDLGCYATGCPCRGTVSVEGGKFMCSAHAHINAEEWPRVTEKLRDHDWLIGLLGDMRTMDRRFEDWRGFAMQFWSGEDARCQPDPGEDCFAYQNRMRKELLFRCGVAAKPQIRLPQKPTTRGNAAAAACNYRAAA